MRVPMPIVFVAPCQHVLWPVQLFPLMLGGKTDGEGMAGSGANNEGGAAHLTRVEGGGIAARSATAVTQKGGCSHITSQKQ